MSEKLKVIISAHMQGASRSETMEIEIDKNDYDKAEDKELFLKQIHDEYISELVCTGYYVCSEE